MRGKEEDGQLLCTTTAAYRSGGLLGHAGNRWIGNMSCGWIDALPLPGTQIQRGGVAIEVTQHPCSLHCTLETETTASALFQPGWGTAESHA